MAIYHNKPSQITANLPEFISATFYKLNKAQANVWML